MGEGGGLADVRSGRLSKTVNSPYRHLNCRSRSPKFIGRFQNEAVAQGACPLTTTRPCRGARLLAALPVSERKPEYGKHQTQETLIPAMHRHTDFLSDKTKTTILNSKIVTKSPRDTAALTSRRQTHEMHFPCKKIEISTAIYHRRRNASI